MMSNFRTVARLGTKQWARISSLLRYGSDTSLCYAASTPGRIPNYMPVALLSSKDRHEVNTKTEFENDPVQNAPLHKTASSHSETMEVSFTEDKRSDSDLDPFSELLDFESRQMAGHVVKSYEYKLTEWNRKMKVLQNSGRPVELKKIVSEKLPNVVAYALSPQAPPDRRHKCLALLLSQDTDDELTEKMLHQIVDDALLMPIKVVADIVQTLSISPQTSLRKGTRVELVRAVANKRWYEIPPKHVVFFMYQLDELFDMRKISYQLRRKGEVDSTKHRTKKSDAEDNIENESVSDQVDFSEKDESLQSISVKGTAVSSDKVVPVISINLETRAINLADQLKVKDLARVVILMAKWRSRNQTLLNAVIHRLCQADLSDFNFLQLNNLLFACATLSIHNDTFLRKLTTHMAQTSPTSPSLACAVVVSMSHLRWDDAALRSKCLSGVANHMSEVSSKDALNVLMSLANLYAVPVSDNEAEMVKEFSSRVLSPEISATERLNCAWCLAVLKLLDAEVAESVLQPDFIKRLLDTSDSQKVALVQKLQSINTAAKYEVKGYSGPFLSEEFSILAEKDLPGSDKKLSVALVNALRKFADLSTYTKVTQTLPGDIVADAVMCANSRGEVRPLTAVDKKDTKENIHMLALQLVPFTGVISPSQIPVGSYQMTARHLRHLGYLPVQILYSDLRPSQNILEQINNIKTRIQAAVEKNGAVP